MNIFTFFLQAAPADTLKQDSLQIKESIEKLAEMSFPDMMSVILDGLVRTGLKILAAILIYMLGAWLIKKIKTFVRKIMDKRHVEASLSTFLLSFLSITLTIILILATIGTLGVDTSSFVALLAGSGVAIGMALSGTLQNFAGGIMILFFKPFKVGDYIEAQGFGGTVNAIHITSTRITTPDNKLIILPNGALSNGTINNYSTTGLRRCDWNIAVSYGDDVAKAKELMLRIVKSHPEVLNEPAAPFVALESLRESSVNIVMRAWVGSDDYWSLYFSVNEEIYNELPKNGIRFPFPQMDVHLTQS